MDARTMLIEARFARGTCPIRMFAPPGDTAGAPVLLLFMDAFGPRPALFALAERAAGMGCRVLLPDLFYHRQPFAPFDPATAFADPGERARLMELFGSIDEAAIDADVAALLDLVADRHGAAMPVAAAGYCMGGRYALTAAAASARVVLAASFHGSNLAPDTADSPHHRLAGSAARIYIGVAQADPTFGGAEAGRLAAALRDGGVDHTIETYAGAAHGFVMPDLPVYDARAAERHWRRLSGDLTERFADARASA